MTFRFRAASVLALSVFLPAAAHACATCGCSLSTDAATGYSAATGWRVDLQYTFIDQSQLRSGTHAATPSSAAAINDNGGAQEVERETLNQFLTFGVTYSPNAEWNFNAQLPYEHRNHTTFGNATSDQLNEANLSGVAYGDVGDLKLLASYQGLLPTNNLGVQLGVKLPTGRYGGQNTVTGATVGRDPVFFTSGPNAAAHQSLDTSLQPGTGSTDVILGAYYYQPVSQDFDAFVNGRFQVAANQMLDSANANYRPGNLANLSFGVRYENTPLWVPQLQINVSHKSGDQGALADAVNTAGTVIYASPGISFNLDHGVQAFGFVQVPVYSWLQGFQLFPRWTANAGISYSF